MNRHDDEWLGFWIGQQPTLQLCVTYVEPQRVGDFPRFLAEAAVPGFKAQFDFDARLGEFEAFRDQVRKMHETLHGSAHFQSIEGHVEIDSTIDHHGHVFWELVLRSRAPGETFPELTFRIEEDQTLLWNVAAKIDDMLEALHSAADIR